MNSVRILALISLSVYLSTHMGGCTRGPIESRSDVEQMRLSYVRDLKNISNVEVISTKLDIDVAVLLARQGDSESFIRLWRGLRAARRLEIWPWALAIENAVIDRRMLRNMLESQEVDSRRAGAILTTIVVLESNRERLWKLVREDDDEETIAWAMQGLVSLGYWEDIIEIYNIEQSDRTSVRIKEGARLALGKCVVGRGKPVTGKQFRAYLQQVVNRLGMKPEGDIPQ